MIRAIVTDIEGTTSSLSFVKDALFPYAREHLPAFVRANAQRPDVRRELNQVQAETGAVDDEAAIQTLLQWIDEDRKATPLKTLQGMIWERGFAQGDFQGHIYEDAARRLREWHAAGLKLYVYSSGSVQAQKLLFAHTAYGDLTPLFSGYFDTTIGNKREAGAYRRILQTIGLPGEQVLFLSDVPAELDAARAARMRTLWLVRDEETDLAADHTAVRNFHAIDFNALR
ncbi:acireductone synthase [Ectothiorhodospiraceae bacterium 2226]|nr:acireductone synthase [Ectothiorhodospiraceae bacterium 2226]